MLASKRYKDDLEKQKAERTNIENSLECKAMVEKKPQTQETRAEIVVKELRKSSDTKLLKADEKQDGGAWSKAAAFIKAVMQKENVSEDLTTVQSKIETDLKTMA